MDLEDEQLEVDETDPTTDPSLFKNKTSSSSSSSKKKDFSEDFHQLTAHVTSLPVEEAIELLLQLEKQSRLAGDSKTTADTSLFLLNLCFQQKHYQLVMDNCTLLFKRRGQFKTVQERMIQFLQPLVVTQISNVQVEIELIQTLRHLSEGRLFLEVERARLTKRLSAIYEAEDLPKASAILQEEQVENYGGLERREKVDYLLEQVRLVHCQRDFVRMAILLRKINVKWFSENHSLLDLKHRYFGFMLLLHAKNQEYFDMAEDHLQRSNTGLEVEIREIMLGALCLALSPYSSHSSSLILKVLKLHKKKLVQSGDMGLCLVELLEKFVTKEIFPLAEDLFSRVYDLESELYIPDWKLLMHTRIVEHNIRVVARYYTRISLSRFASLLGLSQNETEVVISRMVTNVEKEQALVARMDRLTGIVTFGAKQSANQILTDKLEGDLSGLLKLVEMTVHEISKENMLA